MKVIYILVVLLMILVACSNDKEEAAENLTKQICAILKNDNSPAGIQKAKETYINNFVSKFDLTAKEQAEYLIKFRKCFANMGFSKQIKPLTKPVVGTVADYLTLKESNLLIVLKNENAPAFSVDMIFSGTKKYTDSTNLEVEGNITLFDNKKHKLVEYNIYPVPDFYLTMMKGNGDFKFTAYLDAIWYPYGKNPFDTAKTYLSMMQKAEYYKLLLDIKGKKRKNKKGEKDNRDQEILDNLQILSAPQIFK